MGYEDRNNVRGELGRVQARLEKIRGFPADVNATEQLRQALWEVKDCVEVLVDEIEQLERKGAE